MTGAAAGKGGPKRATPPKRRPRPRNEREETWPTKQTGTDMPPPTQQRGGAPNEPKLSDREEKGNLKTKDANERFAGAPG